MYTERRSECRYKRDHFCAVARCLVRSRPPRVSMLPDYAELDTHTHTRARARVSTNTHTYLLGLLGTSEQLVTEVATYKTHTKKKKPRDEHPCAKLHSNQQSQHWSSCRPPPQTARPPRSTIWNINILIREKLVITLILPQTRNVVYLIVLL